MRAGYSTGALARWRALHETATRAEFISRAGSGEKVYETAERYLDHAEYCRVRQFREVEDLLRSIRRDPARPYREGTASFIDQLIAKYGKVFLNDYGWAHALLLDTSDDYKADSIVADVGADLGSPTSSASLEAEPVTRTAGSFCMHTPTQQYMERPTHQSAATNKEGP